MCYDYVSCIIAKNASNYVAQPTMHCHTQVTGYLYNVIDNLAL